VEYQQQRQRQQSRPASRCKTNRAITYLHIAPDGDWWIGSEIFAAKHLQPDYVRSFILHENVNIDNWLQNIGEETEQTKVLQKIYDDQKLPDGIGTRSASS